MRWLLLTGCALFFLQYSSPGQCLVNKPAKLRPEVLEEVKYIKKKATHVESQRVGIAGRSNIYPHFEKLRTLATEDELSSLTEDKDPIIRCYAFWGLCENKVSKEKACAIVLKHLCDTIRVHTLFGCIGGSTTVGDFMISQVHYDSLYKLSAAEWNTIDSLLFWTPYYGIKRRAEVIEHTEATPQNYARLRTLYITEGADEALIPLLSLKNKDDVTLVEGLLKKNPLRTFKTISKYHYEVFKPLLSQYEKENRSNAYDTPWLEFYEAVFAYNDDFTMEMLRRAFTNTKDDKKVVNQTPRERQVGLVAYFLEKNSDKKYDSIRVEALQYVSDVENSYFRRAWNADSLRVLSIIEQRLTTENHPYWRDSLLDLMAKKIVSFEKDKGLAVINGVIKTGYSYSYIVFSKFAHHTYNSETVQLYKDRFINEEIGQYSGMSYSMKGILVFDRPELYNAIANHAFSLAENKTWQKYPEKEYFPLLMKIDGERAQKLLLEDIATLKKPEEFLVMELIFLLDQKNEEINKKLVLIHQNYKNADDKKKDRITWILRSHKLL